MRSTSPASGSCRSATAKEDESGFISADVFGGGWICPLGGAFCAAWLLLKTGGPRRPPGTGGFVPKWEGARRAKGGVGGGGAAPPGRIVGELNKGEGRGSGGRFVTGAGVGARTPLMLGKRWPVRPGAFCEARSSAVAKKLSSSAIAPRLFQPSPALEISSILLTLPSRIHFWSTARESNGMTVPSGRRRFHALAESASDVGRKILNWWLQFVHLTVVPRSETSASSNSYSALQRSHTTSMRLVCPLLAAKATITDCPSPGRTNDSDHPGGFPLRRSPRRSFTEGL